MKNREHSHLYTTTVAKTLTGANGVFASADDDGNDDNDDEHSSTFMHLAQEINIYLTIERLEQIDLDDDS